MEVKKMIRYNYLGSAAVAAALMLGGCVTQETFEKAQGEKAQEISALQSQRAALERQLRELEQQKTELEQQKTSLEGDRAALERQQAQLRAQNEALEQQKQVLLSASKQSQSQYDKLVNELNQEVQKGQLQVRRYKDMLTVDVAEQLFFDSGRAALKETGKDVLKKVADAMKSYEDKAIRVVGHTDNVPITKGLQKVFPSNWELSAARATTVVRFLQDAGIEPERLLATGRAEYAPVAPNDSPEGRQKNRRIEITLIDRNLLQEAPK
ncbi:MAG TPA: OmpA family protein [Burkholderiales bacterium]